MHCFTCIPAQRPALQGALLHPSRQRAAPARPDQRQAERPARAFGCWAPQHQAPQHHRGCCVSTWRYQHCAGRGPKDPGVCEKPMRGRVVVAAGRAAAAVGPQRGALPRAGAGGLEPGFGALAGLLFKGGVSPLHRQFSSSRLNHHVFLMNFNKSKPGDMTACPEP